MSKKNRNKNKFSQPGQKPAEPGKSQAAQTAIQIPDAIVKPRFHFDWIGRTSLWFTLSTLIIIIGVVSMVYKGITTGRPLNFGIDFTGGTVMTLRMPELEGLGQIPAGQQDNERKKVVAEVREILKNYGLADSEIQVVESDVSCRTRPLTNDERTKISQDLSTKYNAQLIEVDTIGPTVGKQLQKQALLILITAIIALIAYIAIRFELAYAVSAVLADCHDVLVMFGLASIFGIEINIAFPDGPVDMLSLIHI